jgi:hypothetical protein
MKYVVSILFTLVVLSCRKERSPAPDLDKIYGTFSILDSLKIAGETVDFTQTPTLNISARFSIKTDLNVNIKGLTSNFEYNNSAFTDVLNLDWNGKADRPPSFGNEEVEITLSFPSLPDSIRPQPFSRKVKITSPIPPQTGYVMATFLPGDEAGSGRGYSLNTDAADGSVARIANTLGGNYFELSGTDKNNWWIGGLNLFPANRYKDTAVFPISPIAASSLYLNQYVYGYGPNSKVILEMIVNEKDGINGLPNESYMLQTNVRWNGWQLLSIPYSRFNLNSIPGNSQKDAHRIRSVEFKCLSNGGPSNTFISMSVANPVFTTIRPYVY